MLTGCSAFLCLMACVVAEDTVATHAESQETATQDIAAQTAERYAWPLELPRIVTSSFAEYRAGRFHAGIDLRTGAIGVPVHAPADGYIAKVRCSPWGYGKAVFLHLNDGNVVVFGHLNDFMPELARFVREEQHKIKNYALEREFGPTEFPVSKGQLVAFSGETGIGEAHLHYEIRDAQERPISQRSLGITWPDDIAPVVVKVLVMPKSPMSRINGDILPVVLNAHLVDGPSDPNAPGNRQYRCDPVRVSGEIGLGVDFVDPANNGDNKLGLHTVRTCVDDKPVFIVRKDRFSYDDRDNEIVSYQPFLKDSGCFLLQWRWPGNRCDIYNQCKEDGWFTMPDHPVDATMNLSDFFENEAIVTVPLTPETGTVSESVKLPAPTPSTQEKKSFGTVDVRCLGEWICVTATFIVLEPTVPEIVVEGAAHPVAFQRVDAQTFRVGIEPDTKAPALVLRITHDRMTTFEQRIEVFHREDMARSFSTEGVTARIAPMSPYGVLFLRAEQARHVVPAPLPIRSKPITLWPSTMPINVPIRLEFPVPSTIKNVARAGVYRESGGKWSFEGANRVGGNIVLETQQLGTYAILEDDQPPAITSIIVEQGKDQSVHRPTLHASVNDVGSGVAEVTVTCDGHWLLCAYDPERNCVDWERDEDLPKDATTLTFSAKDKAGNITTVKHTLPSFSLKKEKETKRNH